MIFETKRIDTILKLVNEESKTPIQFKTRKAIASRLFRYIETSKNDMDFYAKAWHDFPVWCLAFIDDDSDKPLFLAKWQIEYAKLMTQKKFVWALCSRKVGKSTLLALKNLHDMCGNIPKRIICFAPTMKQDYVFEKMNTYIQKSPYLYETFAKGGNITKDYMTFSNGSTCVNRTVGLTTKGELIRGEYGDIVTVDEVQKIEESVMNQVIKPIIADAYSEKKFRIIGTPNLYTNPNLERNWTEWVRKSQITNSDYGVIQIDWIRGVKEGCLDEEYVLDQKNSMPPDEFAMEYEARFPEQSGRFFQIDALEACLIDEPLQKERKGNYDYIMSVDFAAFSNRTQILVGEFDYESFSIKYVDWVEIDPKRTKIDYENQIDLIKDLFWKYDCVWICPDATSNQDALIRMLVTGKRAIPEDKFFKTAGTHEKDRLGYCASDILNDLMWRNHRQQIYRRRIKVPAKNEDLKNRWLKEHNELNLKMIRNGNVVKLEEPKGGYKDFAVAAGMLSMYILQVEKGKASFDIMTF